MIGAFSGSMELMQGACINALGRPVIISFLRSTGVVGDGIPDLAQYSRCSAALRRMLAGSGRFTIDEFSDEIHSFTAVATNAAGEMSAASPAVRVTAVSWRELRRSSPMQLRSATASSRANQKSELC